MLALIVPLLIDQLTSFVTSLPDLVSRAHQRLLPLYENFRVRFDLPAMDDDDLRRGQPTCHIKFGEANAILAGDALQTLAFSILSDAPMAEVADRDRLAMISELAMASGVAGMCGGQALDLEAEGRQIGRAHV